MFIYHRDTRLGVDSQTNFVFGNKKFMHKTYIHKIRKSQLRDAWLKERVTYFGLNSEQYMKNSTMTFILILVAENLAKENDFDACI